MFSSVCPCTLLELHVGSPWQQPTGAISAHMMALTHKPSFGRSVRESKTNNPSTIGPDELLTVRFPDLKENQVIIPSTTKLTFNITLAGTDVNRTLVENLGRNIIRKLVVKLEGNEIISIDDYDILYSFYGCWKTATERRNAIFQGIVEADGQTENAIKHRINATDKANNAKDQTVASIYDNRFCIPLDIEILETSLPLYQYGLGSRLTYELTFADYSDVIKSTETDATYTISNISLEFDTIINASLASQIRTEYMKSSILYDRILSARIIPLNKSDTSFSVDINSPSKVLKVSYSYLHKKGVLLNLHEIPKNFTTLR